MEKLYIVGAGSVGGHIATNPSLYNLEKVEILFIDRDPKKIGKTFCGKEIVGPVEYLLEIKEPVHVVLGVALQSIKKRVHQKLENFANISFPSLVANNAWISEDVAIGIGVIVYPNSSVNYGSTLGDFSILNMNCAVGHDCQIGRFTSLSPGVNLGGNTVIGEFTQMGIGSATKQNISIGENVIIGGQSMVVNNIRSNSKSKGVPAKEF